MHGSGTGEAAVLCGSTRADAILNRPPDELPPLPANCDDTLFAQFAQHSSNALWIADAATGQFHYLNPAARRAWAGLTAIGLDQWSERIHPQDRERVARHRECVVDGEPQILSYRLCDGALVRQYRETSFPIPADGAAGPRVAGIAEDISADLPTYLIDRAEQDGETAVALRGAGLRYKRFGPEEFLRVADSLLGGCAIVDLNGLADDHVVYLQALKMRAPVHSLILIGVPEATQADIIDAMKAGAIDYILHPPCAGSVADAVAAAPVTRGGIGESRTEAPVGTADRLARLPRREHEVLAGLMDGGTNKTIGRTLGISPRTVEAHRAHLMDRLNVRTLTDLIRVAIAAGFQPSSPVEAPRAADA